MTENKDSNGKTTSVTFVLADNDTDDSNNPAFTIPFGATGLRAITAVKYIPTHTDGKATATGTTGGYKVTLTFRISPASAASLITESNIRIEGETATTRATAPTFSVVPNSLSAANGKITFDVLCKDLTLSSTQSASLCMVIVDGTEEIIVSDYIPLISDGTTPTIPTGLTITYTASSQVDFTDKTPFKDANNSALTYTHTFADGTGTITFDSAVTAIQIGNNAFRQTAIETITLPDGVTSIGSNAFSSCSQLESITIPSTVMSIGNYAFSSCSSLEIVTFEGDVDAIGNYAFNGCVSLTTVNYYGTTEPSPAASTAFSDTALLTVNVPTNYTGDTFCGVVVKKTLTAQ